MPRPTRPRLPYPEPLLRIAAHVSEARQQLSLERRPVNPRERVKVQQLEARLDQLIAKWEARLQHVAQRELSTARKIKPPKPEQDKPVHSDHTPKKPRPYSATGGVALGGSARVVHPLIDKAALMQAAQQRAGEIRVARERLVKRDRMITHLIKTGMPPHAAQRLADPEITTRRQAIAKLLKKR